MFHGLSAFPLTPLRGGSVDEAAFARLLERLAAAGVDGICALGSTGNYAYLDLAERKRVARLAVRHAGHVPVMVGIGALRTRDVLELADDAQRAGARAVLLSPMSYQKLSDEEVFGLYQTVTQALSVPLVVYDNPGTTHFEFSDALHGRIAQLPQVVSIKIPPVSPDPASAAARIDRLRALVPAHVSIGISGDAVAATALLAGCTVWYSVIGGLFPVTTLEITRAAQSADAALAHRLSGRLQPLWALFRQHGSLRVVATAAELLGHAPTPCLPPPLRALQGEDRQRLAVLLAQLQLD
ncbi:MAG: dihydrodipicolinate synthase family protein [Melioribacteraceae bacterium]|nr:dihydrodipicolinate synthase family protein [Melioribacteraceae bacterium]